MTPPPPFARLTFEMDDEENPAARVPLTDKDLVRAMYRHMPELLYRAEFDAHDKTRCHESIKEALQVLVAAGYRDETSFNTDPKKLVKAFVKAGQTAKTKVRCLPLLSCLFL